MIDHENFHRLDELLRQDSYARSIGVEIVDWGGGIATASAAVLGDHLNFLGGVHGGFVLSGADVALGVASNSWGRVAVATSIDIHYLAPPEPHTDIEFIATEVHRDRKLGTYALEARSGARTVATATAVAFRTDQWHLGADEWTESWRAHH